MCGWLLCARMAELCCAAVVELGVIGVVVETLALLTADPEVEQRLRMVLPLTLIPNTRLWRHTDPHSQIRKYVCRCASRNPYAWSSTVPKASWGVLR